MALTSIVPRDRTARALAAGLTVSSLGTGLYTSTSILFFVGGLGLSAARVGTVATVAALAGLVFLPAAGALLDRIGTIRVATVFLGAEAAAMVWLSCASSLATFAVGTFVAALAAQGSRVARGVLTAQVAPPGERGTVRAQLRSCANLGVAVGAGAAAGAVVALPATQLRWLFVVNAATFVVLGAVYVRGLGHLDAAPSRADGVSVRRAGGPRIAWTDRRYVVVMAMNGILGVQYAALTVGVPVLVSSRPDVPAWTVPATLVVNTAVVVVFQATLSARIRGVPAAGRAVLQGGAVLALSSSTLGLGHLARSGTSVAVLVLVVAVVHSVGEIFQVAGAFDLSYDLADPAYTGSYQAVHAWTAGAGSALGPVIWSAATAATTWWAPGVGGAFLAAGATTWFLTRREGRSGAPSSG